MVRPQHLRLRWIQIRKLFVPHRSTWIVILVRAAIHFAFILCRPFRSKNSLETHFVISQFLSLFPRLHFSHHYFLFKFLHFVLNKALCLVFKCPWMRRRFLETWIFWDLQGVTKKVPFSISGLSTDWLWVPAWTHPVILPEWAATGKWSARSSISESNYFWDTLNNDNIIPVTWVSLVPVFPLLWGRFLPPCHSFQVQTGRVQS